MLGLTGTGSDSPHLPDSTAQGVSPSSAELTLFLGCDFAGLFNLRVSEAIVLHLSFSSHPHSVV